jgi:hypothetical protein
VDRSIEGVIQISLRHKHAETKILLFGCYVPPEHSTRGRLSHEVFSYLSTNIYQNVVDADCIIVCGDFNARIGNLTDCIAEVDVDICTRNVLDDVKNSQGEEFIEFLQEMNMCVLNGRFSNDNFTCISSRGKSVVDYLCVLQDQFNLFNDFRVHSVTDMIDKCAIMELISDLSRPPDHSIIIVSVHLSPGDALCPGIDSDQGRAIVEHEVRNNNATRAENNTRANVWAESVKSKSARKYDLSAIPNNCMSNGAWRENINVIIDQLQSHCEDQNELDCLYDNMCRIVFGEMDKFLNYKEFSGRKTGKLLKFHKPYWNDRLTELWKDMSLKEKYFLKNKGHSREKLVQRNAFVSARSQFDRYLRSRQREYRKKVIDEIDSVCTKDPRKFWDHIKNLGPKKMLLYRRSLERQMDSLMNHRWYWKSGKIHLKIYITPQLSTMTEIFMIRL